MMMRPPACSVDSASSRRGAAASSASSACSTRVGRPRRPRRSAATAPPGPCSACARRSTATHAGSTVSSATIATSDAPASPSIPTEPNTWRLASTTYALPGPTTTSTGRSAPAPNAIAAIACAPPIAYTSSTSAIDAAAARIASSIRPSAFGRRTEHDLGNAGDARRERGHQHRRRERREAARDVTAGAIDRHHELAAPRHRGARVRGFAFTLRFVPGHDLVAGELERGARARVECARARRRSRPAPTRGIGDVGAVEAGRRARGPRPRRGHARRRRSRPRPRATSAPAAIRARESAREGRR